MGLKSYKILLISFCLMAASFSIFAAPQFIIVPPGDTYTSGFAVTGNPVTQVVGIPFAVSVVAIDNSTNQPFSATGQNVSMTSTLSASITPVNTFFLGQSIGAVSNCLSNSVNVTMGTTGNTILTVTNPNFFTYAQSSVTIPVQALSTFAFSTIPSGIKAGTAFPILVTAQASGGVQVTGFNGSATLTANYIGTGSVSLGTVTFVNGVYSGNVTLYKASTGNVTLTMTLASPSCTGSGTITSIAPAALSSLVTVAPGETYIPGTNGGTGKSGSPSQEKAGVPFNVTVYAVDAYWNTVTAASTVTMTSTDLNAVITPTQKATTNGQASFSVQLETVSGGTQTVNAGATGATASNDVIPLTFNTVDHFNLEVIAATKIAGAPILITVTAVDLYNNTVTSYSSSATAAVYAGAVAIPANHFFSSVATFSNGTAFFNMTIYQAIAANANIKLTSGAVTGDTNGFAVLNDGFAGLIFLADGETLDQGNSNGGVLGISGTPVTATVGTPYTSIKIYSVDDYDNIVAQNDTVSLTTSDTSALINNLTPPQSVNLSNGTGSFSITFRTGGNMTVNGNDTTSPGAGQANITISVLAASLSSFEVDGLSSPTIAGTPFTMKIIAKDSYGNKKTDYTGIAYVSSNTDWTLPYETTMNVTGTNTGAYGSQWEVTFTANDNGERDVTAYLYRAATFTAQVFVSDVSTDTASLNTGHIGLSIPVTVTAASAVKLQVLPPGVQARPGTADGVNNTPTGQGLNTNFNCIVNLTDNWWNIVTGAPADNISVTSSDPPNTLINNSAAPYSGVFLSHGTATFPVSYSISTSTFEVKVSDISESSMTLDWSLPISIFSIFDIGVYASNGSPITAQVAGTPFSIEIVAYSSHGVTATGFTGTVSLAAVSDNGNASQPTISTTTSVTFTAGVAIMPVTIYRARTNNGISATFGSLTEQSNSFDVNPGPITGIQVLPDGMTNLSGLRNDNIPGYFGYSGTPSTVEAGSAHGLYIYYVDNNYNIVYTYSGSVQISSTDTQATVDGNSLPYTVSINAGSGYIFQSSNFVLRTVGALGYQYVTVQDTGAGHWSNTTPKIPVRNTVINHFGVSAPYGPANLITAGVPFKVTVTAYDVYGNTCNGVNGGTVSSDLVNLISDQGANTMLPAQVTLSYGVAVFNATLFFAPDNFGVINASSGAGIAGASNANNQYIYTVQNVFERLLVTTTGMLRKPGYFTDANGTQFPMYDTTRPPFYVSSGPNATPVNDAAHTPLGYVFTVYACDAYGNVVTGSADVLGQTASFTTDDVNAVTITPVSIDETSGQTNFNVIFHTAMSGVHVTGNYSNSGIQSFTTPDFITLAGTPFGLQELVPGLTVNAGSGNYYGSGATGYWVSGVTGSAEAELSGASFPVTVQAADIYGNFTNSVSDNVKVYAGGNLLATTYPELSNAYIAQLDAGITTLTAHLDVASNNGIALYFSDIDNSLMNQSAPLSPVSINVIIGTDLSYDVFASGTNTGGNFIDEYNTTTAYVAGEASPATFGFKIQVVTSNGQPVNSGTDNINFTVVSSSDIRVALTAGTLGIQSGAIFNGKYQTNFQSYTDATSFRIAVTGNLPEAYSPIIQLGANPNSVTFTVTAQKLNVRANTATSIYGKVVDSNGNPVSGVSVGFVVQSGNGVFDQTSNTKTTSAVTGSDGTATVTFYGGYDNEADVIKGTYNSLSRNVTIDVSVVDPILGNVSNYPNPFRAGSEVTNISYLMDSNQDVTIKIYNLFGDLVYSASMSAGTAGASSGMNTFVWDGKNSKGQVVGNGGYICAVTTVIQNSQKTMIRKIAVAK